MPLFLLFLVFYVFGSKKASTFMWNKGSEQISKEYIKNYNRGVAFLYVFLGLLLFIVGLVSNYLSFRLSNLLLFLVLFAGIPTLSYAYSFLVTRYKK